MTPEEKPNISIGITHGGVFQADEVFATALLKILYPNIKIMRVSEVPDSLKNNPAVIIYDIGLGKYDHHQNQKEARENGVIYSAFGLIWRDFGHFILPNENSYKFVDKMLVEYIDRHDNGIEPNLLSIAFNWLNMSWPDKDRSNTENFNKAVDMAKTILEGLFHRKKSEEEADRLVNAALDRNPGHILILDKYIPLPPFIRPDVFYYIYPNERDGYNVSVIIDKTKSPRRYLPAEWYRKKPEGLKFIHKNTKFANFDTLEHAIDATNAALNKFVTVNDTAANGGFSINTKDNNKIDVESIAIMQDNQVCVLEYSDNDLTVINMNPLYVDNDNTTVRIDPTISYGVVYKHNWGEDPTHAGLLCDVNKYNTQALNKIIYILYKGGERIEV